MSRKILIAFDLYAFFKFDEKRENFAWSIDPLFWQVTFSYLVNQANNHHIDIIFEIISIKDKSTYLLDEFIDKIKLFKETCTVTFKHLIVNYCPLSQEEYNFIKPHAMLRFAQNHDIPTRQCLLIDGSNKILEHATNYDIQTLSLTLLNSDNVDASVLALNYYKHYCKKKIESELFTTFNKMIDTLNAVNPSLLEQRLGLNGDIDINIDIKHEHFFSSFHKRLPFFTQLTQESESKRSCSPTHKP